MRFIQGHALVHLLSPVSPYSYGLYIYIGIVSAALLEVGQKGDFYSHKFTHTFWSRWIMKINVFVLFYNMGRSTPFYFRKILRDLLCSWGFYILLASNVLRRRLQKCKRNCWMFLHELPCPITYHWSPLLSLSCCLSFNCSILAMVSYLLFPVQRVSKFLWGSALLLWEIFGEVFSLIYILVIQ